MPRLMPTRRFGKEIVAALAATIVWSLVAARLPAATYNVRDQGAKGDGAADDAPALQKLLKRVCSQGGGTLYFPGPATYLVKASKENMVACGNGRCVFAVTANHVRFLLDPGAHVRVVSDDVPKSATAEGTPSGNHLFYFEGSAAEQPFVIGFRVQGGLFTWEADNVPLTDANAANHWRILGGAAVGSIWRDAAFDGFPQGGRNFGMMHPDRLRREHSLYENCSFLNWGGGAYDSLFQVQGETVFAGCTFRTDRDDHGNAIELGGDRPGLRVRDCLFEGVGGSRGLPLYFTDSTGGEVVDVEVRDTRFVNCRASLIGDDAKAVRNARFAEVQFLGGGLNCAQATDLRIADVNGGHVELDNCHRVDIHDSSSTIHIVGTEPSTAITIHHCTIQPPATPDDALASLIALRSVRGAIIEGCILDVSNKDRPAITFGGVGAGAGDVLFRGNQLIAKTGSAPLLSLDGDAGATNVTIEANQFSFQDRDGTAIAILANAGKDVTIRDNRFDLGSAKLSESIVLGRDPSHLILGPWLIETNRERGVATAGGWKLFAAEVTLRGNTMLQPFQGKADADEENHVAPAIDAKAKPKG